MGTTSRPPNWIKPQLTRLVDEAPAGHGWLHGPSSRFLRYHLLDLPYEASKRLMELLRLLKGALGQTSLAIKRSGDHAARGLDGNRHAAASEDSTECHGKGEGP